MAKRNKGSTRAGGTTAARASDATTAAAMEQRMMAFAEQLGRTVGTIQAKAEGWMDRKILREQLASVRDGAVHLLEQLGGVTAATKKKPAAPAARGGNKGRSGGVVDAPGKTHRKQAPRDPEANVARNQAAKMRTAMTMVKTNKRRGRG